MDRRQIEGGRKERKKNSSLWNSVCYPQRLFKFYPKCWQPQRKTHLISGLSADRTSVRDIISDRRGWWVSAPGEKCGLEGEPTAAKHFCLMTNSDTHRTTARTQSSPVPVLSITDEIFKEPHGWQRSQHFRPARHHLKPSLLWSPNAVQTPQESQGARAHSLYPSCLFTLEISFLKSPPSVADLGGGVPALSSPRKSDVALSLPWAETQIPAGGAALLLPFTYSTGLIGVSSTNGRFSLFAITSTY